MVLLGIVVKHTFTNLVVVEVHISVYVTERKRSRKNGNIFVRFSQTFSRDFASFTKMK